MNIQQAIDLAILKAEGNISEQEDTLLSHWILNSSNEEYTQFTDACIDALVDIKGNSDEFRESEEKRNMDIARILTGARQINSVKAPVLPIEQNYRKMFIYWPAAAVLILTAISFCFWLIYMSHNMVTVPPVIALRSPILTQRPELTTRVDRMITVEGPDIEINADTQFVKISLPDSTRRPGASSSLLIAGVETVYQQVAVPKGIRYDVHLPDGSRVWLNALSTLSYPKDYGINNRTLQLDGEALFEIKNSADKPFVVKARDARISVLGTRFNINCYSNEPDIKVTLLNGAVNVQGNASNRTLKPGEQAVISKGDLAVQLADTASVTAWQKGIFSFQDQDIYTMLRELERWHNIEVDYSIAVPPIANTISWKSSRKLQLDRILDLLRRGKIGINRDGQKLRLSPL